MTWGFHFHFFPPLVTCSNESQLKKPTSPTPTLSTLNYPPSHPLKSMAPSAILLCAFCIFLSNLQSTRGSKQINCNTLRCGDIDIQFPFGLRGSNQDRGCRYYPVQSFQLSCLHGGTQTILTLPGFGNLTVKSIDYESQSIRVNDPDGCLPKRFLQKWSLSVSDSPFVLNPMIYGTIPFNLTFLRCPSNVTDSSQYPLVPISCLSNNSNYSVIASWSQPIMSSPSLSQQCQVMSRALVPLPVLDMPMWPFWPDLNTDLDLVWTEPDCRNCALSGQVCGFSKEKTKTPQVRCFARDSTKGMFVCARVFFFLFNFRSVAMFNSQQHATLTFISDG